MLVGQRGQQFSFPAKACQGVCMAAVNHFDGYLATEVVIHGQVDLGHASSAQQALEGIVAKCYSFQGWHRGFVRAPCLFVSSDSLRASAQRTEALLLERKRLRQPDSIRGWRIVVDAQATC